MNICFTGHRPDKLGGYDWNSPKNQDIMSAISMQIMDLLDNNPNEQFHFICGGALGIDQMAFHICNKLKFTYKNITTEIAVPFRNQYIKWNKENFQIWRKQLYQADKLTLVDRLDKYKIKDYQEDIYYPAKMELRNHYMVDNSDLVIAVWDGTNGGTGNCVNYAKKMNKKIIIINPKEL